MTAEEFQAMPVEERDRRITNCLIGLPGWSVSSGKRWSTDNAAAAELIEEMRKRGWYWRGGNNGVGPYIGFERRDGFVAPVVQAVSFALAVTTAAYLALSEATGQQL